MPGSLAPLQQVSDPRSQHNFDQLFLAWPPEPTYYGTGSPNTAVTAGPGALYVDIATGKIYVHESSTPSNTGWVLYSPFDPVTYFYQRTAGNYTSASATYVAIDATNLNTTKTFTGLPVHVALEGTLSNTAATNIYFGLFVDGTLLAGGERQTGDAGAGGTVMVNAAWTFVPAAGSHVLEVRWRQDAGTSTLSGGATQGAHFWVTELLT